MSDRLRPVSNADIIAMCDQHALDEQIQLDTAIVLSMAGRRLSELNDRLVRQARHLERMEAIHDR